MIPEKDTYVLDEDTYVDKADKVMKEVMERHNDFKKKKLTTSQIRNLLALTADIYNEVMLFPKDELTEESKDELTKEIKSRINYLKVRFVYEAGRHGEVKEFVEKAQILKCLDEIQGLRGRYLLFSRYMEALVAYHKWYGGQDQ